MGTDKEFKQRGFGELADYNRRVSQGIVHTKEYIERMKLLQEEFNKWIADKDENGN